LALGRSRLERAAARARNGDDLVLGVDAFLHNACLSVRGEADGSAQTSPQQGEVRFWIIWPTGTERTMIRAARALPWR
jgi:hypothetical protein